jgi:hypothetical protein
MGNPFESGTYHAPSQPFEWGQGQVRQNVFDVSRIDVVLGGDLLGLLEPAHAVSLREKDEATQRPRPLLMMFW